MQGTIRTTELGCSLKNRIKTPSRGAVDEKTNQDALIEKARSGLYPCAREEEKSEEVVMDAEVEGRDNDAEDQEGDEDGVNAEVAWEAALEAEIPHLAESDCKESKDDDDEGKAGARLGAEIGRCQSLDGDEVEGVIIQRANPCATKPENRSLDVGVQVFLLILDAVTVENCCYESGGKETANDEG